MDKDNFCWWVLEYLDNISGNLETLTTTVDRLQKTVARLAGESLEEAESVQSQTLEDSQDQENLS